MAAASSSAGRWAVGDRSGLRFPADVHALRDGGSRFLTKAFRSFGVLAPDDDVTGITRCEETLGGSTGRKVLLSVQYRSTASPRHLFVKFSRDFEHAERDRGRTQMAPEIEFAHLSRAHDFPVAVPTVSFGDYEEASGSGILVTERIPFGHDGIEHQHAKCMDYDLPEPLEHYRALLGAVGRLAGTHAAGRLPNGLTADMEELSVGARAPLTAERLTRRVDRLGQFADAYPALLPANVRSPTFLARLRVELPRLLDVEAAVWRVLRDRADFVALCHWNANVDNAWFWRDDAGTLRCGLMDWGCVGQMNVAMAIWGAMCSAEVSMWNEHLDALLAHFASEFLGCGGGALELPRLTEQVLLYAAVMGMTWLLDVPGYVRVQVPALTAASTRMDPGIKDVESVRCRLQMMTNVLNLWERHDVGRLVAAF